MNAARLGQTALRIKMPSNLDVTGTQAKASFEQWCKDEGLTLTWESRSVDLEDGRRATVFEPEIQRHARGQCSAINHGAITYGATDRTPFLPLPDGLPTREEDWT